MTNTTHETLFSLPERPPILHPLVVQLLHARGLDDTSILEKLSWDLKKLPDLTNLKDLSIASNRIVSAILNKESIGIYGDYDVDGTTSCALLYHFFKSFCATSVHLFQPDRFKEGYGLHLSSIDVAKAKGIKLLITVDCGITNAEAASYAKEQKIDLIITDHHSDILETPPDAFATINPNRRDENMDSPLRVLAGVGVAFALCLGVKKELEANNNMTLPSLYSLLPFVAIGTLCDMVPLSPLNLKLVRHGMKELQEKRYPGLNIFFLAGDDEGSFVKPYDYEKITFQIGPMINSKGRLEHPEESLFLLISENLSTAKRHHEALFTTNQERKKVQQEVVKEAFAQLSSNPESKIDPIHILYSPKWHEGVIGIAASRVVEKTRRPVIIFTNAESAGMIKGSARSYGTLNLFEVLQTGHDLYTKFGGHKAAAGLTLPKENLPLLKKRLKETMERSYPKKEWEPASLIELTLPLSEITVELLRSFELLEPFGTLNPRPHFKLRPVQLESFHIMKEQHVRWEFVDPFAPRCKLKGVSFHYFDGLDPLHPEEILLRSKNEPLLVDCTLHSNVWKGREYLQIIVHQIGF